MRWPSKSPRKKTHATETPTRRNPDDQVLGESPEVAVDVPSMTTRDQSREGVSGPTSSLATPKHTLRVGAWNVRTMYETGKTAQVFKEMERYGLNILGLSEIRWTGSGKITLGTGATLCYSGRSDGQHHEGVGIAMDRRGVYQNWSRSSCDQETEQHLEVHNSQYQNQAQNLPVQRTFSSSLRLRDVENQQEVGEQTSGLRREIFTENIES